MAKEDKLMEGLAMAQKLITNKEFMTRKGDINAYESNVGRNNTQTYVPLSTPSMNNNMRTNSKLPKEIYESLMNEPISEYGEIAMDKGVSSVLDRIQPTIPQPQVRQTVNENLMVSSPTVSMPVSNNGIDYSVIKALIDESIKRNLSELKTELINENTSNIKTMRIVNGNKVQVLDNQGNLYEGTLTFKKKIEKK